MTLQGRHTPLRMRGNPCCIAACKTFCRERLEGNNGLRIVNPQRATHRLLLVKIGWDAHGSPDAFPLDFSVKRLSE
jgi:hypothetical protein